MMYRIAILYECKFGFKEINDIAAQCGFSEKVYALADTEITMNFADMPDKEQINLIGEVYQRAFNKNADGLEVMECRFKGYSDITPISQEGKDG